MDNIRGQIALNYAIKINGKTDQGKEWKVYNFDGKNKVLTFEFGGETEEFNIDDVKELITKALNLGITPTAIQLGVEQT